MVGRCELVGEEKEDDCEDGEHAPAAVGYAHGERICFEGGNVVGVHGIGGGAMGASAIQWILLAGSGDRNQRFTGNRVWISAIVCSLKESPTIAGM